MSELFNLKTLIHWLVLTFCFIGLSSSIVGALELWTGEELSFATGSICVLMHEGTNTPKGGFLPRK